jgi:glucose-1-phosphate thymidylyltransferase
MKAIIPAAGIGTRLRPHTFVRPKVLLTVAGKPILAHILDELLAVGVDEVVLVVGYLGDQIEAWTRAHYGRLRLHFEFQPEALGNGHAVYVARDHLDGEPAIVIFGDTIVKGDLGGFLRSRQSMAAVKTVDDPRRLGVVELDATGRVKRIIEKPTAPPSNLAVIGLYFIHQTRALRTALEQMVAEDRRMKGEYWLADALQLMIDSGEVMGTVRVDHWYDCGTVEALLQANRDLLRLAPPPVPPVLTSSVMPPSYVSTLARVEGSVIGPFASIGDRARIVNSHVKDSIVEEDAVIEGATLEQSLVGPRAVVRGVTGRVNVGDSSVIELPLS